MAEAKLTFRGLVELAEQGTLDGPTLQRLFEHESLDEDALVAAYALLWRGPEWSEERWPVDDPNVRMLPSMTKDGISGLEPWVPFGEGWEIPAGFEYAGSGPFDWRMWVQVVDGRAECVALQAWSRSDRAISAGSLRHLPLGRLVQNAVLVASRPADEIPKQIDVRWPSPEAARRARAEVSANYKRTKRSPRDRRPITDETLREVAEVYRANLAGGAPTRAVADELHYSRASAGRLVMEARRRGFLPSTEPRKARG